MGTIMKEGISITRISTRWELIPLEKRKLIRSFFYGMLAVVGLFFAQYLEQYGLPEQFKYLSPFIPVVVNFLRKFSQENTYHE